MKDINVCVKIGGLTDEIPLEDVVEFLIQHNERAVIQIYDSNPFE